MINMKNPSGPLAQEVNLYYNLFPRSTEFENSVWAKVSSTLSSNVMLAPNGNAEGDRVTSTNVTARIQGSTLIINTVLLGHNYNMSVYAKPETKDIISIRDQLNSPNGATFNLTTLTATTTGNGTNAIITSETNGWYRCSVDITPTSHNLHFAFSGGITTGTMGLWGAQLTEGYGLKPYQFTSLSFSALQYDAIGFFGAIQEGNSVPLTYYIRTGFNPSTPMP